VLHDDKLTGWTFECPVDSSGKPPESQGGIVLREMRHDGHNFAREVRMIGLWIEIENGDGSGNIGNREKKLRTLSASNGFTLSPIRKLEPTPILNHPTWKEKFEWLKDFDDALNFSDYIQDPQGTYSGYGVAANFDAPDLFAFMAWTNCDFAGLSIEQVFLFSHYSDEPPHEPTTVLTAARFHPLVRFELKKNPAFDPSKQHTRVVSIRFDFRLHLYLDSRFDAKNAPQNKNTVRNQAGLFADRESVSVSSLAQTINPASDRTLVSGQSFSAIEKPIVLEIAAPGLVQGFTDSTGLNISKFDRLHDVDCWDNVHWWGMRATPNVYVSAPGAFHCAHSHWRWGSVLAMADINIGTPDRPIPVLPIDTGVHFQPGTPLLDPGIPWQTLQIAVTQNAKRFDPAQKTPLTDLTERDWETLFERSSNNPPPVKIADGDDIVLWYSTEVLKRFTPPGQGMPAFVAAPQGTVFLHGFFFAHDDEMSGVAVGTTNAEHRPSSAAAIEKSKKWFRPTNW
jgi:hypothetical protein